MKFKNGQYLKICSFDLCQCEFYGRLNQLYCSGSCKNAHNNQRSREVKKMALGSDLKINKAVRILLELFSPDIEGKCVLNKMTLIERSFPFDLPTFLIKDDRCHYTLNCFGVFCFHRHGDDFIFYKI